jgi:hypothetical protein
VADLQHDFFYSLPRNILRPFWGRNLFWHGLAIGVTVLIVCSDFDWRYFKATRPWASDLFPAVIVGLVVPILFPVVSYIVGSVRKDQRVIWSAYATAQAGIIGLFISSLYKAFTGRPGLGHSIVTLTDMSKVFHFGFLQGGVFYGWPSTHTTVAVAIAAAIWKLYPDKRLMRTGALLYGVYVGVGVSMTIHWFSDCVAGAIFGAVIGNTVGNFFAGHLLRKSPAVEGLRE